MSVKYDKIGINYATKRQTDPRLASQILQKLQGATRIINIGAGSGSYEPENIDLIAVEPSQEMIKQRSTNAHPVVQASAESLPFEDNSFSHALTILSMHHWTDRSKAFQEINRVTTDKFIALSWNPKSKAFWLTRNYFPEIIEWDKNNFPTKQEFEKYFDDVNISPLLIPSDCRDGFLAAYWKRPEAYLDINVRNSISSFSKLENIGEWLKRLEADISSGKWHEDNKDILNEENLDAGYIIISAKIRKT